jgi:hypothetical protein
LWSSVYGASKAFVRQFSLNLRADLLGTNVPQSEPDGFERLRAMDPKSGEILTLGGGPHGRRFEVMYYARGA